MDGIRQLFVRHRQFLLYCTVGAANTLITMAALWLFFDVWHWNHGVSYALAYAAGVINGYFWSTRTVFRTRGTVANLTKFILVNLATLAVNQGLMWLFVDKLGIYSLLAQALVVPFTFIANFSLNRLWTFAQPGEGR